ncbi:MAG TPA: RidA family protein [Planctomycetota bacterium]|nr:RidA family protein [Planctomycetota bacterium]
MTGPGPPLPAPINPPSLGPHPGFSHGIASPPGRLVFVAGQIGADSEGRLVAGDFAAQFDRALERVLAVVREAGGQAEHLARLTIYVKDRAEYAAAREAAGRAWRARLGRHYPAVTLVEVKDLLEPGARLEMEGTAVVPQAP